MRLTPGIPDKPDDADQGGGGDQKTQHRGDYANNEAGVPSEPCEGITILGPIGAMVSSGRFAHGGTGQEIRALHIHHYRDGTRECKSVCDDRVIR
jgi:hypothetical protein